METKRIPAPELPVFSFRLIIKIKHYERGVTDEETEVPGGTGRVSWSLVSAGNGM
jgi:hypothetical protein